MRWSMCILFLLFNCGLFVSAVSADDYCITCPSPYQRFKCESPSWCGGDCGQVWCGVKNPGCSSTYYDGRYCTPVNTLSSRAKGESSVSKTKVQQEPGSVTVTSKGNNVTIKMTKKQLEGLFDQVKAAREVK